MQCAHAAVCIKMERSRNNNKKISKGLHSRLLHTRPLSLRVWFLSNIPPHRTRDTVYKNNNNIIIHYYRSVGPVWRARVIK